MHAPVSPEPQDLPPKRCKVSHVAQLSGYGGNSASLPHCYDAAGHLADLYHLSERTA
jgi:hypothetical protein